MKDKRKVFVINGIGTSGKDTFISYIGNCVPYVFRHSYITPVLDIARKMGWKNDKSENGRLFLAKLEVTWSEYNNKIFDDVVRIIEFTDPNKLSYHFIIIRRPEIIEKFKTKYPKLKTILIERSNVPIPDNPSDKAVNNYNYDIIIKNDGTIEELYTKCNKFITKELKSLHRFNKTLIKRNDGKYKRNTRGQFVKRVINKDTTNKSKDT